MGPTTEAEGSQPQILTFPPCTKDHILHCSYHSWYKLYRAISPKARLIALSQPFVNYLHADGIMLPPDDNAVDNSDSGSWTAVADTEHNLNEEEADEDEDYDPSREWPEIHAKITATIAELGGSVSPKLNWSAPRDATWMLTTNDMRCTSANDVYLLLKSSNFITHDLDHAFDDCVPEPNEDNGTPTTNPPSIPYHLVLRKHFNVNPSLEFRCFVRNRELICLCQRDSAYYDFLAEMDRDLLRVIQSFFDDKLRDTFPDPDFVFDVYVPPAYTRAWLIDINPFAPKTDPLLFSWQEILGFSREIEQIRSEEKMEAMDGLEEQVIRLHIKDGQPSSTERISDTGTNKLTLDQDEDSEYGSDIEEVSDFPIFRLVGKGNPAGTNMNASAYSAHKLPKDVVDASSGGIGGMSEFLTQWRDILDGKLKPESVFPHGEDEK
ncbi:hypothetical protein FQN57_002364 [Myotisia sp. PD_48]|nr:hypothetical protein FQN57_002364 [Myotisia sp. PD_48]